MELQGNFVRGYGKEDLTRQYLVNAMTAVGGGWIYCAFTLIDGVFIAKYMGASGLAILSLALPALYIPFALSSMLGVGASTLVSRALGVGNVAEAKSIFSQTVWTCVIAGLVLAVLMHFFTAPALRLLNGDPATDEAAIRFIQMSGYFFPFLITAYTLEFFLRIEGAPGYGLACLGTAALLNIVLDYFCLAVWKTNLEGVAIATGLCHGFASALMLGYHLRRVRVLKFVFNVFRERCLVHRIAFYGLAELVTDGGQILTIAVFNSVIYSAFGVPGLAAYAVLEYLAVVLMTTVTGLVHGMQPIVSFHHGAGVTVSARRIVNLSGVLTVGVAAAFAACLTLFPTSVLWLFATEDAESTAISVTAMKYYALALVPASLIALASGYLTAVAKPFASTSISIMHYWICSLAMLYVLPKWFGPSGIWLSMPVTEILVLPLACFLVWRGHRYPAKLTVG